eukprot:gene9306-526_t
MPADPSAEVLGARQGAPFTSLQWRAERSGRVKRVAYSKCLIACHRRRARAPPRHPCHQPIINAAAIATIRDAAAIATEL